MVTLVRGGTGTLTTGHRDTESRGDTEITEMSTGVVTATTPGGREMVTVDRGGIETTDILPLTTGLEAGVAAGSGMSMRTTLAMGIRGGRRTSVGTDFSGRIIRFYKLEPL